MASFLSLSLDAHISLKSLVIHGQNLSETRLLRKGARFSSTRENIVVHCSTMMLTSSECVTIPFQSIFANRPFSYSEKESQSNDTLLHFVGFSNVHKSDRSSNATRSNLVYKNV